MPPDTIWDVHYSERLLGHVKRAEQATQAAKEHVLRDYGITPAQQAALAILSDHDGITAAELARKCAVTPQTMTSTVGRLEKRGLIERIPHPLHGTLIEIRLTRHGRDLFDRADAQVAALDAALAGDLTATELDTLKTLLAKVTQTASGIATETGRDGPGRQHSRHVALPRPRRQRFRGRDVKGRAANLAAFERDRKGVGVYVPAAGDVDQPGAVVHPCQLGCADDARGLRRKGQGHERDERAGQNIVQRREASARTRSSTIARSTSPTRWWGPPASCPVFTPRNSLIRARHWSARALRSTRTRVETWRAPGRCRGSAGR
jgi:DNA-binding MarR family transcriptional regulator